MGNKVIVLLLAQVLDVVQSLTLFAQFLGVPNEMNIDPCTHPPVLVR